MATTLSLRNWSSMLRADLLKVLREPFFWLVLIAPFLLGYGVRFLLPYLERSFPAIELTQYFPVIIALIILTSPLYYGFVLGLQILDEKDENVLLAVAVTPISLKTYLAARLTVYTLLSIPIIVIVHEIIGALAVDRLQMVLIAVAASLNTPLFVLLLSAFARNQLEGFVIAKSLGFVVLFPLAMFFVPDYWHLICGVLPTYWPIIAYYTAVAEDGSNTFFAIAILMSVVMQPVFIVYLYRRFQGSLLRV